MTIPVEFLFLRQLCRGTQSWWNLAPQITLHFSPPNCFFTFSFLFLSVAPYWLSLGSLWLPFGSRWHPFGSLLQPFRNNESFWCNFRSILHFPNRSNVKLLEKSCFLDARGRNAPAIDLFSPFADVRNHFCKNTKCWNTFRTNPQIIVRTPICRNLSLRPRAELAVGTWIKKTYERTNATTAYLQTYRNIYTNS